MSELKTQATTQPVAEFLDAVADERRRADCHALSAMMEAATGEPPVMWGGSIVGFGRYRYKYASGHGGDWPIIGFSPRKNDLTLYLGCSFDGQRERLARLGKHKTGKACLYLKGLADVDQETLRELIDASVEAMAGQRVRRDAEARICVGAVVPEGGAGAGPVGATP